MPPLLSLYCLRNEPALAIVAILHGTEDNMKILAVVETAIYVDDLNAAEDFYHGVLGLDVIAKEANRHVFFRVGEFNVLLTFIANTTAMGGNLPPHGATGPGHFALGIETSSFDAWRQHLAAHGVPIETEIEWPSGGRSIYVRDPADNSVELITPGVWGLPSGW